MFKVSLGLALFIGVGCAAPAKADPPPISVNCKSFLKIAETGAWHVLTDTSIGTDGDGQAPKVNLKAGDMILPKKVYFENIDVYTVISAKCSTGAASRA